MQKSINENEASIEAVKNKIRAFSYLFLLVFSVSLILLIFKETQWVDTSRGWYLQPRATSLFGLTVFSFFTFVRVIQFRKNYSIAFFLSSNNFSDLLERYRTAVVSSFVFLIYIFTLSVFGFALATFFFIITLLWLSRLLNFYWLLVSFFSVVTLVLIFRVGVNLWLPDVWIYDFLPSNISDFMNKYF